MLKSELIEELEYSIAHYGDGPVYTRREGSVTHMIDFDTENHMSIIFSSSPDDDDWDDWGEN